jgi:hypothetical protein
LHLSQLDVTQTLPNRNANKRRGDAKETRLGGNRLNRTPKNLPRRVFELEGLGGVTRGCRVPRRPPRRGLELSHQLSAERRLPRTTPIFAGTNAPANKACTHRPRSKPSKSPINVNQTRSQVPSACHWVKRRQQVIELTPSRGRSGQRQPVLSTCRMPSRIFLSSARGRP